MTKIALQSTLLLIGSVALACEASDATDAFDAHEDSELELRASEEEPEDKSLGDRLDAMPYVLDVKALDGKWVETLDLTNFDPEKELSVFVESYGGYANVALRDPASSEVLAEAEQYAEFEEEGGESRFVSTIKIDPASLEKVELAVGVDFNPRISLLLCGEVVTSHSDSGPGSLRRALADVQNGGSICFDPITFESDTPVQLTSELLVGKDVSISATAANGAFIQGNNSERLFNLGAAREVSMRELFLSRGEASDGGLIKSRGNLFMRECAMQEGEAVRGGALYSDGLVFLNDTAVNANEATNGGAVYCDDCRVYVDNSELKDNSAARGGAIYSDSASLEVRNGSQIYYNDAQHGGGLYVDSPGGVTGTLRVNGGSIRTNLAVRGGGVYLAGGRLTLEADPTGPGTPAAIAGNQAEYGGGVYVDSGFLDIESLATVRANLATGNGAGVFNLGDLTMTGDAAILSNDTDGRGGGVYNGGYVYLHDRARIANNHASVYGGGVFNSGHLMIWDHPSRIELNDAGHGGGLYNTSAASFDALDITIVNNTPNNVVTQ